MVAPERWDDADLCGHLLLRSINRDRELRVDVHGRHGIPRQVRRHEPEEKNQHDDNADYRKRRPFEGERARGRRPAYLEIRPGFVRERARRLFARMDGGEMPFDILQL